jgi:uncharacterized protein (DUF2062 family)
MPSREWNTQNLPRYWTPLRITVLIVAVAAIIAAAVRLWFFEFEAPASALIG